MHHHHPSNIVVSVYSEHHYFSASTSLFISHDSNTYFQLVLGMEMRESLPSQVTIVSTVLLMNKIPMYSELRVIVFDEASVTY